MSSLRWSGSRASPRSDVRDVRRAVDHLIGGDQLVARVREVRAVCTRTGAGSRIPCSLARVSRFSRSKVAVTAILTAPFLRSLSVPGLCRCAARAGARSEDLRAERRTAYSEERDHAVVSSRLTVASHTCVHPRRAPSSPGPPRALARGSRKLVFSSIVVNPTALSGSEARAAHARAGIASVITVPAWRTHSARGARAGARAVPRPARCEFRSADAEQAGQPALHRGIEPLERSRRHPRRLHARGGSLLAP